MRILAIDTALGACSVVIMDAATAQPVAMEQVPMARGHAEALVPMLARVAEASGQPLRNVDRVAVTVGPGSYTGLRVGVSAARAVGLAAGVPVVGVTTLSALAAPVIGTEFGRLVCVVIDARHGHVYTTILGTGGRTIIAPRIASLKEAARLIGSGPVSIIGSAALMVAQEAWAIGLDAVVLDTPAAPDIRWVARLGLLADPAAAPPLPVYMRAPDAQPQDRHRLERQ
jgi:tRNA threonylcarbamoyladenosine biosynthesis protein TsaB